MAAVDGGGPLEKSHKSAKLNTVLIFAWKVRPSQKSCGTASGTPLAGTDFLSWVSKSLPEARFIRSQVMAFSRGRLVGKLGLAFIAWGVSETALAQQPLQPAAAPDSPRYESRESYQPGQTYDSLQAGQDAQRLAEERRADAIQQQLPSSRWPSTWGPAYAAAAVPRVYVYPGPRAARWAYRYGYGVYVPWPRAVVPAYPYPRLRQPIGHERIWTGPNGYIYRPIDPRSPVPGGAAMPPAPQVPTPADPATRPQPGPPAELVPIPEPQAGPGGPREF